jgi:hemerythrin superfamily protein
MPRPRHERAAQLRPIERPSRVSSRRPGSCTGFLRGEDTMNIYDALSKDHRLFESQLDRLVAASKADNDQWKSTLDELRRGVIAHAHAEEAVFYNALREANESKGLVMHSYAEHAMAEGEMRTLGAAKMVDANWTSLMEKLSKDLRHHIEEEESRVYEAARKVFNEQEAQQIGAAFERMKLETAKDGDSMLASNLDLIANLLPPRLTEAFRKHAQSSRTAR